jgi:ABC-2 type transport system permease protein
MMQLALNDASGTGSGRYRHFMTQVFAFHDAWRTFFTTRFLKREPLTTAEFDAFPRFGYVEESLRSLFARLVPSLLGMAAVSAALLAVAFTALRRYRVGGR